MPWISDQPCPRCGGTLLRDGSEWVCASCSRRRPALPQPVDKPPEPPNRCLICNMPTPVGQHICGKAVCHDTLYDH